MRSMYGMYGKNHISSNSRARIPTLIMSMRWDMHKCIYVLGVSVHLVLKRCKGQQIQTPRILHDWSKRKFWKISKILKNK